MPRSPARQPVKGGHLFVRSHFATLDFALCFFELSPLLVGQRPEAISSSVIRCLHLKKDSSDTVQPLRRPSDHTFKYRLNLLFRHVAYIAQILRAVTQKCAAAIVFKCTTKRCPYAHNAWPRATANV